MSYTRPSFDLIIPCYNPGVNWENELLKFYENLRVTLNGTTVHLILVNDGSTHLVDSSSIEKLRNGIHRFTYIENKVNKGKGHALRAGVKASTSELIIFTDVDFPYEIQSISAIYHALCNGTDIAFGYREEDYYNTVPLFRKILSKILRWSLRSVMKLSVTDTQCGLKGFNYKGKKLFLETHINRFLFDLEFVMLASKDASLNTKSVRVSLRNGVVFSKVNLKTLIVELLNFVALTFPFRKFRPAAK